MLLVFGAIKAEMMIVSELNRELNDWGGKETLERCKQVQCTNEINSRFDYDCNCHLSGRQERDEMRHPLIEIQRRRERRNEARLGSEAKKMWVDG
jgi:hypothetical protein